MSVRKKEVHELVSEEKTGKVHARRYDGSYLCKSVIGTVGRIFPSESMEITCTECYLHAM